jgi:hypothetical protein
MENIFEAPIFKIKVDYDDETGMIRNSFVDEPAVQYHKINFSKEELLFSQDATQQKFYGVSILADTPIPRKTKTGDLYYVVFDKETINVIANKLVMENKNNEVNYNHMKNEKIDGVFLVEQFILEKGRVESPLFKDVPDGSLMQTYWVKDKEKYQELANDPNFNGFSIELSAELEEMFSSVDETWLENKIKEIVFNETISDEEKEQKVKNLLGLNKK